MKPGTRRSAWLLALLAALLVLFTIPAPTAIAALPTSPLSTYAYAIIALTGYSADLTAYNLQIDQIHTYYAGTTPVLAHNSCDDYIADKIAQHAEHDIPGVADADLPDYVRGVMQRTPGQAFRDGRTGWWDPDKGAVVIREGTGGTVFVPSSGDSYFLRQLAE